MRGVSVSVWQMNQIGKHTHVRLVGGLIAVVLRGLTWSILSLKFNLGLGLKHLNLIQTKFEIFIKFNTHTNYQRGCFLVSFLSPLSLCAYRQTLKLKRIKLGFTFRHNYNLNSKQRQFEKLCHRQRSKRRPVIWETENREVDGDGCGDGDDQI